MHMINEIYYTQINNKIYFNNKKSRSNIMVLDFIKKNNFNDYLKFFFIFIFITTIYLEHRYIFFLFFY